MWKGWEGLDVWHCSCKSRHASFCITCSNSVLFHKIPMQQQTKHTQPIYHLKLKFSLSSSLNWHDSFNSVCTQTNIFFFKISSKPLTESYLSWCLPNWVAFINGFPPFFFMFISTSFIFLTSRCSSLITNTAVGTLDSTTKIWLERRNSEEREKK